MTSQREGRRVVPCDVALAGCAHTAAPPLPIYRYGISLCIIIFRRKTSPIVVGNQMQASSKALIAALVE
ncbi:hypothetical protein ANCCEY_02868 [Ancylostoma ceylanicum]|uniref:Uncharacterized protein n=1 Tax=Ancylostoma ceylanicum TaxID=53326 RepID=A0A0D6M1R9_9BILA|nr:hypothetical protein ANCCEY_02868 [Ancylostoma ceylanicum]